MSKRRQKSLKRFPWLLIPVALLALLAVMATQFPSPDVAVAQPGTCVDDVTGVSNVCTANDVTITYLYNGSVISCVPGEMVTLTLRAEVVAGANERWDIGLFIAEDGGNAYTGSCYKDYIPPPLARDGTCSTTPTICQKDADCPAGETCIGGYSPGENFPGPEGGPFFDGEPGDVNDLCGDLEQGVYNYIDLDPVSVPCIDSNGDGSLDIGTIASWDNTQNNTCTGLLDAVPNTKSKCRARRLEVTDVFVPKFVEVVKALVPPDDGGLFDLQIDGTTWYTDASHGDTTGPQEVMVPTAAVGELAGTGTDLANYSTSILCYDRVGRCSLSPTRHCTNDIVCGIYGQGTCEFPNPVVASCDPCTGVNLDIPEAETNILCTITNTRQIQRGSITIVKATDPPDSPQPFGFSSTTPPLAFSLSDGDSQPFPDLPTGLYTFTETVPLGWELDRIECTGQEQSIILIPSDGGPDSVTVELAEAEDVVCTFYNFGTDPDIVLVKSLAYYDDNDSSGDVTEGDDLWYNFTVTNTGNVTLDPVTVTDDSFGISVTCPVTVLDPTEGVLCTADSAHTVTEAESLAGNVHNVATATGTPPVGPDVTDEDELDVPVTQDELAIAKTCTEDVFWCDDIDYQVTVTNTGGVTLTDVLVEDPLIGLDEVIDLAPRESRTFTGTYNPCPPAELYTIYLPLVMRGADFSPVRSELPSRASALRDPGTITNTVTATCLYLTAEITATDSCSTNVYRPVVTKDAQPGVERTYKWTIDKSVDEPGPTLLYVGDFVEPEYTVVVDLDDPPFVDSWSVAGTITVANPAPMDAKLWSVRDMVSTGYVTSVDCPSLTVPAGGSLICTYGPIGLPNGSARTNTAVATLINNNGRRTNFSDTVSFDFSEAGLTVDEEVDVSDTIFGDFGTVRYDEVPATFPNTGRIVAEGDVCNLFEVNNEAIFVTNDTGASDSASAVVQVFELCTVTLGYEDLPIAAGNDWDYNDLVYDVSPILDASPEHDLLGVSLSIYQEPGAGPPANLTAFHHEAHLTLDADEFVCSGTYTMSTTVDGSTTTDTGPYNPGDDFTIIPDTLDRPDLVELEIDFDVPPVSGCPFELSDFDFVNNYHGEWLFFDPWLYVYNTAESIHRGTETVVEPRILTVPVDWQWPVPDGNQICNPYPKVTACVPGPPDFVPFWWDN